MSDTDLIRTLANNSNLSTPVEVVWYHYIIAKKYK
jgi:hypothetical protein